MKLKHGALSTMIATVLLALSMVFVRTAALADAHDITVTTDGNGTGEVTTSNPEDEGMRAFVLATPDDGYVYDSASVDPEVDELEEMFSGWPDVLISFLMPGEDVAVSVTFTEAARISYDANGGTEGDAWMDEHRIAKGREMSFSDPGEDVVAPPEGMMYEGVEVDGVFYGPDDTLVVDSDISVVYRWVKDDRTYCTIAFDANGGTPGSSWLDEAVLECGSRRRVWDDPADDDIAVAPKGLMFAGVEIEGVTCEPGSEFVVPDAETATVKLLWSKPCTMVFDANGGTEGEDWPDEETLAAGTVVEVPEDAEGLAEAPEGMVFGGIECDGVVYAPGEEFTIPDADTITVKFVWVSEEPEPEPEPEPTPESEPAPAPEPEPAPAPAPSVPKTGDPASMAGILATMGAMMLALTRRRR